MTDSCRALPRQRAMREALGGTASPIPFRLGPRRSVRQDSRAGEMGILPCLSRHGAGYLRFIVRGLRARGFRLHRNCGTPWPRGEFRAQRQSSRFQRFLRPSVRPCGLDAPIRKSNWRWFPRPSGPRGGSVIPLLTPYVHKFLHLPATHVGLDSMRPHACANPDCGTPRRAIGERRCSR